MARLRGQSLAEEALRIYRLRQARYPTGITIPEFLDEFRIQGVGIWSDDDARTLRDALNKSQGKGTWSGIGDGMWRPGDGQQKSGLSGRPLAEALYAFVRDRYRSGEFGYEEARIGLERTGVAVQGLGDVTIKALAGSPDLFSELSGRDGRWRWL